MEGVYAIEILAAADCRIRKIEMSRPPLASQAGQRLRIWLASSFGKARQ
jgi:hypothetical protein